MLKITLLAVILLIGRSAFAQPALPCTPNALGTTTSVVDGKTYVTYWTCASDGKSWIVGTKPPAGINAATATALQTPRTIAGVSFDGTANIAIPSTGLSDSANLPRLDALTNAFVSGVTTQAGGLSVAGAGLTNGRVMSLSGSTATPGASGSGGQTSAVLRLGGNLGSTQVGTPPVTTLLDSGATINSTTSLGSHANALFTTTVANTVNPAVAWGVYSRVTDYTAIANNVTGIGSSVLASGNAAKSLYGMYTDVANDSTTANESAGITAFVSNTGAVTSGVQNTYGVVATALSASLAGATANVFGGWFQGGGTVASGTINSYGFYIANASGMNTTGTSKNVGLYVEEPTGADTNYGAIFAGGNVGIGTTAPTVPLHVGTVAGVTDRDLVFFGGTVTPSAFGSQLSVRSGTINAAANNNAAIVYIDGTIAIAGSGTHPNFFGLRVAVPALTAGAGTVTNASTLYVDGAPTGATNNYALNVAAGPSVFGGTVRLMGYTVATLPAGVQGDVAFVTDALAPVYMAAVAGGGAVVTGVFYNGAAWVVR